MMQVRFQAQRPFAYSPKSNSSPRFGMQPAAAIETDLSIPPNEILFALRGAAGRADDIISFRNGQIIGPESAIPTDTSGRSFLEFELPEGKHALFLTSTGSGRSEQFFHTYRFTPAGALQPTVEWHGPAGDPLTNPVTQNWKQLERAFGTDKTQEITAGMQRNLHRATNWNIDFNNTGSKFCWVSCTIGDKRYSFGAQFNYGELEGIRSTDYLANPVSKFVINVNDTGYTEKRDGGIHEQYLGQDTPELRQAFTTFINRATSSLAQLPKMRGLDGRFNPTELLDEVAKDLEQPIPAKLTRIYTASSRDLSKPAQVFVVAHDTDEEPQIIATKGIEIRLHNFRQEGPDAPKPYYTLEFSNPNAGNQRTLVPLTQPSAIEAAKRIMALAQAKANIQNDFISKPTASLSEAEQAIRLRRVRTLHIF